MLNTAFKKNLKSHTNAQDGPPPCEPGVDDALPAHAEESTHACVEGPHPWYDESIRVRTFLRISRHYNRRTHPFECALNRSQISGAVIQDGNASHDVSVPLVEGTPTTRASRWTAVRSERATDLNWASTT